MRGSICLPGTVADVNTSNCARAKLLAHELAGNQQSTNQNMSCSCFATVQVATSSCKDNTLHRKCAKGGVVAEATRSEAREKYAGGRRRDVQSISGYMRSSFMTCHITEGFSLPEGARERSIQLFADDRVARGHLIGQILQMWRRSQQQSSSLDS